MNDDYRVHSEEDNHIIMEDTMAIFPWYTKHGELHSTVFEQYQVKTVKKSPLAIIDESCDYYGSSYLGRVDSAANILKGQRMLPIVISEQGKTCMLPLCSPSKPECIWLSFKHVLDVVSKKLRSVVILSNYQKIELDISKQTLDTKLNKAARILSTYEIRRNRIEELYKSHHIAEDKTIYIPSMEKPHHHPDQ